MITFFATAVSRHQNVIFCYYCKQAPKCASPNSSYLAGTKATRSNSLEKHTLSNPHIKAKAAVKAAENPHKTPLALALRKIKGETLKKIQHLFNTAYFVAREELAFVKFEKLCSLQSLKWDSVY